ncbi:DEAD/DEAH box helicase [Agromyces sp. Q22]|uniref:ATP-dependent RNA helicase DeaD n=1 Tax=Agromyces kandeliae TaxID=2666141 RepID=A0A6L5R043_9MICO|nr:DEAD/DEAH box helicase [Agromyces kandeliae]
MEAEAPQEPTTPTFADLGLEGAVLRALDDVGYETPSAIQAATIPTLLEGRDVVGLAQTGTGKTAAFALPILARLDTSDRSPQALVLAPTRELALQVCEAFEKYAAHLPDLHILPVYGGQGYGVQLSALRRGVHIVVGTPGRVIDHLDKGTLDLSGLKYLVLDEADEMLKMGFAEDVETILADTPEEKQVALFSATMPAAIRRMSEQYLTDPEQITVKTKTQTSANITQRVLVVAHARKVDALTRILEVEDFGGVIIFVRTKNATEELAEKLRARGYEAAAINGDIAQVQRERTVEQLKSGKLDILVATDVAARGLDVERITHVVNYDIPTDPEPYVHRIGRTGRAGRTGDAISFVTPRERGLLARIEKTTKQRMTPMDLPSVDEINESRLSRFDDRISAALEQAERISGFRDIIAHYVRHHDVPETDVAAALAVVAQGDSPLLMEPEPEPAPRERGRDRFDRDDRGRDRFDRDDRGGRDRSDRQPRAGMAMYRLDVGKRHRVMPGQIVGALANEGGLARDDFGAIRIQADFSLVELPANLPKDVFDRLADTRISGRLIDLRLDTGGRPRRQYDDRRGGGRGYDRDRGSDRGHGGGRGYDRDRGSGGGRGYDDRGHGSDAGDGRKPRKPRHGKS